MIDEFNLSPPIAPPEGVRYLTSILEAPVALLVKDTPTYINPEDPRDVVYAETVKQFLPGEIITEDMLNLTPEQRSIFIGRYIKSGILSDNTLTPTPPTVGIETVSTCNYAIQLTENGSTNKLNVSYDTLDHLQTYPVSYVDTLLAIYYRDVDGISYSLDSGKNIIQVKATEETNLKYPEEITSCAALVYSDVYNSSLKTRLYIGTLREGLKSIEPGQSVFVQETDLEKGHFLGEADFPTYFFRTSKWNVGKIKSSAGDVLEYLPGEYQPCYVLGLLNYPDEANNPILVYVKNTIVDSSVTSSITNLHLDGQALLGDLTISGTSIKAKYKFFTKNLTSPAADWTPLYVSEEVKKLDLCDVLKSAEYNSLKNFSTVTPDEVGQIIAVACPRDYSNNFIARLLKYYYNTALGTLNLEVLPKFTYASIKVPDIIDPNDVSYNSGSLFIDSNTETLIFTLGSSYESQWLTFIDGLRVKYPTITFIVNSKDELTLFSSDIFSIDTYRFSYSDLSINPNEVTGLSCYTDFGSNSKFRETVFLTTYNKIWKLSKVIDYSTNSLVYSWGKGPWMSSNNPDPDYSFRLDKSLNFPFLNIDNKFDSDQIEATTTYLHGLRNFCLYKPMHTSNYVGYCGSDLGLIRFEFAYSSLENDFRFLDRKLPHRFDRRAYSSWNTDLVFDNASKILVGCGLKNHPPLIYDISSENEVPVRYFYFEPTYATKPSLSSGILTSKLFYKNYSASYISSSGFIVTETPSTTSEENIGTIQEPNLQVVNRYSAINKYNFALFQDERRDQFINAIDEFKEFVRIVPRFNALPTFSNNQLNNTSLKFSFTNTKNNLYETISHIPLSLEFPENSGITKVIAPDHITYSESSLLFSVGETDFISLVKSRNALAAYLSASTVKYNRYKLKLRVTESPGKIFSPSLHYENDLDFTLIINEGI